MAQAGAQLSGSVLFAALAGNAAGKRRNPPDHGRRGDKLLPSLLPETALLSERQFLNYLFARNAILAPGEAARLTGVTVGELEEWILTLVKSYPARDWNERYKQFLLAERGGRWLFEGRTATAISVNRARHSMIRSFTAWRWKYRRRGNGTISFTGSS